jgi:hypothetical protein
VSYSVTWAGTTTTGTSLTRCRVPNS